MSEHPDLIQRLTDSLTPVKLIHPTWLRVFRWVALALPLGTAATFLLPRDGLDWSHLSDIWRIAEIALSFLLAVCAVSAAYEMSIPGRRPYATRLFIIGVVVWGALLARNALHNPLNLGAWEDGFFCYAFMLLAGLPMLGVLLLDLRNSPALRPGRVLCSSGAGVFFGALALLSLCHRGGFNFIDLGMHLAAGMSIMLISMLAGRKLISA